MTDQIQILYIDDEQGNLDTFEHAFGSDYKIKVCLSAEEALKITLKEEIPLVIADQRMPGMSGIELCEKLYSERPDTIRMILTAYTETNLLLEAIRRGHVSDYIVKPWKKGSLKPILDKALQEYQQRKAKMKELESRLAKVQILEEQVLQTYDDRGMVGFSSGLKNVKEMVQKVSPTDSTVLLLGETGTGKELLARAIHSSSKRKDAPFIPVHCAALAKTLLESEIFGHEKGAFTGADQARVGRFELANQGTIFLDEIGEIPEEIQVKLLRVLQEREIQRVGGNRLISTDVRLIAATNKNLKKEVEQGRFREDLYFRLNVIPIQVPPLRERKEDIPEFANYFLKKFSKKTGITISFSLEAIQLLSNYDWPGNVRELENIVERAVILNSGPVIETEDLDLHLEEMMKIERVEIDKLPSVTSVREKIQQSEVQVLTNALLKTKGNISEAARELEMPRTNLFRRLKKYKLI